MHDSSSEEERVGGSPKMIQQPSLPAGGTPPGLTPPGGWWAPGVTTPPVETPLITPPVNMKAVAETSGSGEKVDNKRRKVEQGVRCELFPEKSDKTPEKPKEAKPPAPKKKSSKRITLPPVDDNKLSKPRGTDKVQRKARGECLTFAGYRPPNSPLLREQFLRIREEYYATKEAFKGDKKSKKKDDPRNWTPHATQLEYLQFMKGEMAKLQEEDGTTQEKFKKAAQAWGQYCLIKGYVKNVAPEDVANAAVDVASADAEGEGNDDGDMDAQIAAGAVDADTAAGAAGEADDD